MPLASVIMSGDKAESLGAKCRPEASEGGDHLVEYEQDAVLGGNRP